MQLPKIKSKHLDFLILYLSLLFFSGYYFFETMTTPGVILVGGLLLLRAAKIQALDKRTAYFFLIMISNVVITELIGTIAYDMPLPIKTVALTVINMGMGLFIAAEMGIEQFKKAYIACMITIAVVSLITFGLYLLWPQYVNAFPVLINSTNHKGYFLLFSTISDFSEAGAQRNQGIFWEPGAYQVFLSLAFLFELSSKDSKPRKWVLAVLLISIVSTISSVGLVVAVLLIVFYVSCVSGKIVWKRAAIVMCIMSVAVGISIPLLPVYWRYALVGKVASLFTAKNGSVNASAATRLSAIVDCLKLYITSPFLGVGHVGYSRIAADTGNAMLTCTPVNWIVRFGLVYGAILYLGLWRFFKKLFLGKTETIIALVIFLLSISTEDLTANVLFFAMCFMGYLADRAVYSREQGKKCVLQINSGNLGSTGNIMLGIGEIARNEGYVCYTACPEGRSMRKKTAPDQLFIGTRLSRNIHIWLGKITGLHGLFSVLDTWLFLNEVEAIKPDVIHLHNLHDCYINLPMLFGYIKRKNIKTVWTLHDCWSMTAQCPHFEIVGCYRWKIGCSNCKQFRNYPASYVDQTRLMWKLKKKWFTGVKDMTLITPSRWLADLVQESYLKDYPVRVVNNGIDLNVFQPAASDFRKKYHCENKTVILGVAFGWGKRKGLDVFIELSKRLDDSYQIVLVGTNETVEKELPSNILSIRQTSSREELAQIYSAADIFVNPTREDTYPTVNIEALACGTPILTFRTGGSPEILDDMSGYVVEKDDIDALEHAIHEASEHERYSREYCHTYAQQFEKHKKFMEYVQIYGCLQNT